MRDVKEATLQEKYTTHVTCSKCLIIYTFHYKHVPKYFAVLQNAAFYLKKVNLNERQFLLHLRAGVAINIQLTFDSFNKNSLTLVCCIWIISIRTRIIGKNGTVCPRVLLYHISTDTVACTFTCKNTDFKKWYLKQPILSKNERSSIERWIYHA